MTRAGLYQAALLHRSADERREQRVRSERARFQFGMKLHANEPRVIVVLDDLGQEPVGRVSRKAHAVLGQTVLVTGIALLAVALALGNLRRVVNLGHARPALQ